MLIDANEKALLEVVFRVSVHVRAYSSGDGCVTRSQLHSLMDAIHNIPLFLQSGDEDLWLGIEWSMRDYDKRYGDQRPQIRLVEVFEQAGGRFPNSAEPGDAEEGGA
jgi:hypothetical protein